MKRWWFRGIVIALIGSGLSMFRGQSTSTLSEYVSAECLGERAAPTLVVYFHGIDSLEPSEHELRNRQVLQKLANQHQLRIALPRSDFRCPHDATLRCWMWSEWDEQLIRGRIDTAMQWARDKCSPNQRVSGLIGFSNGGLLVNRVVQQCLSVERDWLISVGAPGSWQPSPESLENCGRLTMLMGRADEGARSSALELKEHLEARSAKVLWLDYDGGHSMETESLSHILSLMQSEMEN